MQPQLFEIETTLDALESLGIPPAMQSVICGIDEAGRGCVAGSLFVCGVILQNTSQEILDKLTDSKRLSPKNREILAKSLKQTCAFKIVKKEAQEIDNFGLSACIKDALLEIINSLNAPYFVFDGNCSFNIPKLKTCIKGDLKIKAISAASILAKVAKDDEMKVLDSTYAQFNFKKNKGYCTKAHLEAIKKYGFSKVHRKSYKIKEFLTIN